MLTSYYWLKEALKYQSPQFIILDTYFVYPYESDVNKEIINFDESSLRKAFDYMRLSSNKLNAINDICNIDNEQSKLSYIFPIIRYHDRWSSLTIDDFEYFSSELEAPYKGYSPFLGSCKITYKGFEIGITQEQADMVENMEFYLNKIEKLCREKNIQLILVKTPTTTATETRYNTMVFYSNAHNLTYIDFNVSHIMDKLEYDFALDNIDIGHCNILGATKITNYIGAYLKETYNISSVVNEQYSKYQDIYEQKKKEFELKQISDPLLYVQEIKDERYTVFISSCDLEAVAEKEEDALAAIWKAFGFQTNIEDSGDCGFIAVIEVGEIIEIVDEEKINYKSTFLGGKIRYNIISQRTQQGGESSIKISEVEYSLNRQGINMVIYNNDEEMVIDKVCIGLDEDTGKLTVTR